MAEQRLPRVNSDDGVWGDVLINFLGQEHYNDNTNNTANGGHKNVTIRPGTTSLAPLTFMGTSAAVLTTPVAGSMEYDGTYFYLTQNGTTRRKIDVYDSAVASTTTYTIGATNTVIFANAASNSVTVTLPAASSFSGYRFYIKRTDSSGNTVTVNATSGNLDGAASQVLSLQYQAIMVVSDGSNWWIF